MEYRLRKTLRIWGNYLFKGLLALLVLILIVGSYGAGMDPYDCRIVPGVRVGGLEVGGMSSEEAFRALKAASDTVLEGTALEVETPDAPIALAPGETKASLNCISAVWAAYRVGRLGSTETEIGLLPHLKLDYAALRNRIDSYADGAETTLTPPQTRMSGPMPDLEIENQSESNRPQILELTMGLPTTAIDRELALEKILSVYDRAFSAAALGEYRVENPFHVEILEEPQLPDLEAIYEAVYIAPVDDSLDMTTYEPIRGAYGYHFDLEQAGKLVAEARDGETLSLDMIFQEPEIFGEGVYYRDVLGYCETMHTADENRNNNLRRACESMDGLVLQPGEVFSYNDTLGPRTKENGYLRAGAYSGWELVQAYGGGICQGSSTIYGAALLADLEIVHRRNHGFTVSYLQPGLDATVNWGGPDFQFRNSTNFPIKIAAEVSDGSVKVTILGTEERDYYVEMEAEVQWGNHGVYAKSYKCKYDRETGELISRELEAKSNYAG